MATDIRIGGNIAITGSRRNNGWHEPPFPESCQFFIPFTDYTNEDVKPTGIVKDISGKGNDFKCFNLAYALKSGFGGFQQDYNLAYKGSGILEQTTSKLKLINRLVGWGWVTNLTTDNYNNTTPYKVNVHFEGGSGGKLLLQVTGYATELFEGENTIYPNTAFNGQTIQFSLYTLDTANPSIVTIEQIPIQRGVWLDGIDDYLQSINALTGIKTIIVKFKSLAESNATSNCIYDNRVDVTNSKGFALSFTPSNNGSAYYERNTSGITRINNVLNVYAGANAIKVNQLLGKTHVATLTNDSAPTEDLRNTNIGCTYARTLFSKCIIECIAGYDKVLTEEELLQEYQRVEFYTLPERDKIFLYSNFADKTNQDTDFTTAYNRSGAGVNGTLNNFAKAGLSGAKGYAFNLTDRWDGVRWTNGSSNDHYVHVDTLKIEDKNPVIIQTIGNNIEVGAKITYPEYYIKVTGFERSKDYLTDTSYLGVVNRIVSEGGNKDITILGNITKDGIYKVPSYTRINDGDSDDITYCFFRVYNTNGAIGDKLDFEVELLPMYDGSVVGDGIDDYIANINVIPSNTKELTAIFKFRLTQSNFTNNNGLFCTTYEDITFKNWILVTFEAGNRVRFGRSYRGGNNYTSFTLKESIINKESIIVYTVKRDKIVCSINGEEFSLSNPPEDIKDININLFYSMYDRSRFFKGAIYDYIFLNKALSKSQVDKYIEYLNINNNKIQYE